ncbi:MAG: ribosome maturation factor RimM [Thermaerobacter sp.]|nr:ribosome maturation factor RimM [Thermaerobacter sp.]
MSRVKDAWPGYVVVGEITSPHGIDGSFRVLPMTDYPQRLLNRRTVTIDKLGMAVRVLTAREHGRLMVMRIAGTDSRELAEKLRGGKLMVAAAELPALPEDQFYWHQLVGLTVIEADSGRVLGEIGHIIRTGGGTDVFEVRRAAEKPLLIPALRSVVRQVDLVARKMEVELLPGLEE